MFVDQSFPRHGIVFPLHQRPPPEGPRWPLQQMFSRKCSKSRAKNLRGPFGLQTPPVTIWRALMTSVRSSPNPERPQPTGLQRSIAHIPAPETPGLPQMFLVQTLTGQSSRESKQDKYMHIYKKKGVTFFNVPLFIQQKCSQREKAYQQLLSAKVPHYCFHQI